MPFSAKTGSRVTTASQRRTNVFTARHWLILNQQSLCSLKTGYGGAGGRGVSIWFQIWCYLGFGSSSSDFLPLLFFYLFIYSWGRGGGLIRACFVCLCILQTWHLASSMAVDVEADVSATKRSQVEVTKILPDWTKGEKTGPINGRRQLIALNGLFLLFEQASLV